ncbi:MAG: TetR family transcriptional regulator [Sphingomicrobium sp.]
MSISRQRLSQAESQSAALAAAKRLLIDDGPQAVTLKAVAAKVGRTHANLLHHFGSAAGLQAALAKSIAEQVNIAIADAVARFRQGQAEPKEIIDLVFDAFGKEGAGALAAWMILTGNKDALNPVLDAIHSLVDSLTEADPHRPVPEVTLSLVLGAVGDSLLGAPIAAALGLSREASREIAAETLRARIAASQKQG